MNKPRKTSMRQVRDEAALAELKHSPTYKRAVAAIRDAVANPIEKSVPGEADRPGDSVRFYRGARIKSK